MGRFEKKRVLSVLIWVIWYEGIGHHSDYDGGAHLPFNVGWCGTCYPRGLVTTDWSGVMNMIVGMLIITTTYLLLKAYEG
jgi:hypothetical protein